MFKAARIIIALGIVCSALIPGAGAADLQSSKNEAYSKGVSLYNQKNYRAAAQQFELVMKAVPNNADSIYYCALCQQLSNNRTRARQLFEYLVEHFPQSRVVPMAQSALNQLSALSAGTGNSQSSAGSQVGTASAQQDAELSGVPDLVQIPFEKQGNDITVMVEVNGRSVPFLLDTGAFSVTVGQNHLKEWGIFSAQAKKTMNIGGVGEGRAKGWTQPLDLKLGQIYRKNFPVVVMDNMPTEPLLGQTFLRAFNVSIDENSRRVLLAKKGGTASRDIVRKTYTGVEIPFKRGGGGHMMVNVVANGRPIVMMFDTGCERTSFALSDWKKLGFEIPSGAQQGISRGVLGDTVSYSFNADSIKLCGTTRSIEQENTPVSVASGSHDSLLGMSFFGKYKYTIDAARNVIIFEGVER